MAGYFERLPLLEGRAALLGQGTKETLGVPYAQLSEFAAEADLLLNISGMLRDERLLEQIPVRAFLDLDPGFNQVWHETGNDMGLDLHTHFVTVGQNLGRPGCPIPDCGRTWIPTLPPVALDHWPAALRACRAGTPSPRSATGAAMARSSTAASTTGSVPTRCGS